MHETEINMITRKEFRKAPDTIRRMTNGICNEVYWVDLGAREVIVRLKRETRYMYGLRNHIPMFRTKGIRVPKIFAGAIRLKLFRLLARS
jgi:hypothetical protein